MNTALMPGLVVLLVLSLLLFVVGAFCARWAFMNARQRRWMPMEDGLITMLNNDLAGWLEGYGRSSVAVSALGFVVMLATLWILAHR